MGTISPENKLDVMHRLRADGQWQEASTFRELVRQTSRRAGLSREDAKAEAWAAMCEMFPPMSQAERDAEPIFRWLSGAIRPPAISGDHFNESSTLRFSILWRITCYAIALELSKSKRFGVLTFRAYRSLLEVASDESRNLDLEALLAGVVQRPAVFLSRTALPRLEMLVSGDTEPYEVIEELREAVEAIHRINSKNRQRV
jgi:hypothetical protein